MVGEIVACYVGIFDLGCRGSDCPEICAVKACHWYILLEFFFPARLRHRATRNPCQVQKAAY
jgi:hypothetical protein